MKKLLKRVIACGLLFMVWLGLRASTPEQTKVLTDFLNRIGGMGASELIVTDVDPSLSSDGQERFIITSSAGKPAVKGSTISAVTTGINWYLNHYAHINLSWNQLTTDLTKASLPLPVQDETHTCTADYRYYLNYCTFSYSMSTWTWERWQQEIDWMALHGINMPLQIVGLDVVWRNLLMNHYGYTKAEANDFVAGPCFQAWWGMNNLQGWGGPNPDWWYDRQEVLAKNILARERELGMEPVIPGYAGSVPHNFSSKTGMASLDQGGWCAYTRPYLLDPNSNSFANVSQKYYEELHKLMGKSAYYSIDPFHEGANTSGIDVPAAYGAINKAMLAANPEAKWVIQFWSWQASQYNVLDKVEKGRLIVLDLFSDAHTHFGAYKDHDAVYCTLNNFGGRTGLMGRVSRIIDGYFDEKAKHANVKGVGATPEAIEQVSVQYDVMFELPWYSSKPDGKTWMADYAKARYGVDSPEAAEAWELLRNSALNCQSGLQGPHEAVMCGRPSLAIDRVSSWGGSDIFYDPQAVITAAYRLMEANISGNDYTLNNYTYDLVDVTRQTLSDYSKALLAGIKDAHDNGNTELFAKRRNVFLQMMLDVDRLLNTHPSFMLGHWTEMARDITKESPKATSADADWLERDNARTLITTWGPRASSENGGLRDYSYRQWGGMMKDFYYTRWKRWFDSGMTAGNWFDFEWDWAHNNTTRYPTEATGDAKAIAAEVLTKYLSAFRVGSETYYINRGIDNTLPKTMIQLMSRGNNYVPDVNAQGATVESIGIDFDNNGRYEGDEIQTATAFALKPDAAIGKHMAKITLSDGTVVSLSIVVTEEIIEPRIVSVATENPEWGTVRIDGTDALSVTNTEYVVLHAMPTEKYDFSYWTDAEGKEIGSDNPFTYYGKEVAAFTAHFVENKWGIPPTDFKDRSDIAAYKQYVKTFSVTQNGQSSELYSTEDIPDTQFNYIQQRIKAAPGGEFEFNWTDAGGLKWLFLTTYLDFNADGIFNKENELLGTLGTHRNNNNPEVAAGSYKVLLPFDTPKGVTHIRMRFDSSWLEPWDEVTGAYDANQLVTRFVYELLLEINDSPEYESTVTVKPNNPKYGAVSTDQTTFKPGETVVVFSYPAEGFRTARWVDNHGRTLPKEWMDGNSLVFTVYDNAEITAIFEPEERLAIDDWQFNWIPSDDGAVITSLAQEGSSELDLGAANSVNRPILGMPAGLFRGTSVEKITLPRNVLVESKDQTLVDGMLNGAGMEGQPIPFDLVVPNDRAWILTLDCTAGDKNFNAWGNTLLCSGNQPFLDNYTGGFQFYLTAARTLNVKYNSASVTQFALNLAGDFSIEMNYNGTGAVITVTNAAGERESRNVTGELNPISSLCTAIPTGININSILIKASASELNPADLLTGARKLVGIDIPETHRLYKSVDGVLFNKETDACVAYPEGRLFSRAFVLTTTRGENVYADPTAEGVGADIDGDRRVLVTARLNNYASALWHMSDIPGENDCVRVTHCNTQRHFGGANSMGVGKIEMPGVADNWYGRYVYSLVYDGGSMPKLTLQIGEQYAQANSEGQIELMACSADNSHLFTLTEAKKLPVNLNAKGYAAVSLPVRVTVPTGLAAYTLKESREDKAVLRAIQEDTVIEAGTGFILIATGVVEEGQVPALDICCRDSEPLEDNLLSSALAANNSLEAGRHYVLSEAGLVKAAKDNVPANSAYLELCRVAEEQQTVLADKLQFIDELSVIPVTGLTIDGDVVRSIKIGEQLSLVARCTPANATFKRVIWSCSDETVAEISQQGIVIGKAEGMVTLTAATPDGQYVATCTVKVLGQSVGLDVNESRGAFTVEVVERALMIAGLDVGDVLNVYDAGGKLVARRMATGIYESILLDASGCYLVTRGSDAVKVVLK